LNFNEVIRPKQIIYTGFFFFLQSQCLFAQEKIEIINDSSVRATLHFLASDLMKGRGNGTSDILLTSSYIGNRFKQAGLIPLTGQAGFYIPFTLPGTEGLPANDLLEWNQKLLMPGCFMYLRNQPGHYTPKSLSDFSIVTIDTCFFEDILAEYADTDKDILIWTAKLQPDEENFFPKIINIPSGGLKHEILLVCTEEKPELISLSDLSFNLYNKGYNVAGMLPGKTKPNEVIVFSAHYDHIGSSNSASSDKIYNGANDNASGTAAVIILAEYFAMLNNNERTLLFCAFAGEELGLIGSQDFVQYIKPDAIKAVINIEMIGVPQFGVNAIFITGSGYSDLPKLLRNEMKKSGTKVKSEPDRMKNLFQRSDNYSFAKNGIPAHTIMSSDDDEPCYHLPCDEFKRINISHMTKVIRSIALSSELLIAGKITPGRIK
jgi:hypothetical protein